MAFPDEGTWHDADGDSDAKARAVAEKTLQRLRELNEQFPSRDLADAIKKLEHWRQEHLQEKKAGQP